MSLKILAAQINPVAGDLPGNLALHRQQLALATAAGADLVVFPEMSLTDYPLDDLVEHKALLADVAAALQQLAATTTPGGPALLVGAPLAHPEGGKPYNAAVLLADGKIQAITCKHELPTYREFDDLRNFTAGPLPAPLHWRGHRLGVLICEDIWLPQVAEHLATQGAELLLSLNASPFAREKHAARRTQVLAPRATATGLPILYVNKVGGQDQLIFDGQSVAMQANGQVAWQAPGFRTDSQLLNWDKSHGWSNAACAAPASWQAEMYNALVLATRDYWRKTTPHGATPQAVVGLSGGADSALVAAILADALGPANVLAVRLPSEHTSSTSQDLAAAQAHLLGIRLTTLPIQSLVASSIEVLQHAGFATATGFTEDNLQSRQRGVLLMALTNLLPHTKLASTGNKSEVAMGYCTLYGDTNGGYNPLKDVYKTEVFALLAWRNQFTSSIGLGPAGVVIPPAIISRPPTAETRANQTDEAGLGIDYPTLDAILHLHLDAGMTRRQIIQHRALNGLTTEQAGQLVSMVLDKINMAEFKRQQTCPGPQLHRNGFGRQRRWPIVNAYRETANWYSAADQNSAQSVIHPLLRDLSHAPTFSHLAAS